MIAVSVLYEYDVAGAARRSEQVFSYCRIFFASIYVHLGVQNPT